MRRLKAKSVTVGKDFLDVGDVLLKGGFIIEIKRGRDLTSSMMSNRLFEQLNNMCQLGNPILAIITENKYRDFYRTKSNFIYNQYVGMLSTIMVSYPKVRVVFLENDSELVDFLLSLNNKINREGKTTRPSPVFRKVKSNDEVKENLLTAIKGISVPTSKKLLHHYGSIANVVSATIEDHMQVDKVGKKLAEKLYNILNEPYKVNGKNGKGKNNGK